MIATESINIKTNATIVTSNHLTLPSNARDLIVEIKVSGSVHFTIMTSPDQVNWYQVGTTTHTKSADEIVELTGHSVFQYICVQPTSSSYEANVDSAKVYFGRSK